MGELNEKIKRKAHVKQSFSLDFLERGTFTEYPYVDRYQPMDKAGAYGVQEWIGYIGVKSISGSFYNIMGLPIQKLYGELKKL